MIPGAIFSTGYAVSLAIGPLPSSGAPSVLTTRPRRPLPTGTCRSLPVPAYLAAFLERRVVPENDDADFGLVERQREAGDAVAEIDHLVQHHVRQSLDSGDAVADLADGPDALLREGRLGPFDLSFDVAHQVSHDSRTSPYEFRGALQARFDRVEPRSHAAVVDVASDLHAQAADERRVVGKRRLDALRRAPARRWPRCPRAPAPASGAALSTSAVCRSRSSRTRRSKCLRIDVTPRRFDAIVPSTTRRTRASSRAPPHVAQPEEPPAPFA